MIINKSIISSFLFLVSFSGSLYSQCSYELVSVKQKKCKIMLTLKNTSNETMKISSSSVSYHKNGVFEPLNYKINDDTLSIVLVHRVKILNSGHELQDEVLIDGKQETNYLYIDPREEFIFMTDKSKRQRVTNILVLFENCILEENI